MTPETAGHMLTTASNAAIERLGLLLGEWAVTFSHMSHIPDQAAPIHGRTTFERLEGGRFLLERSEISASEFPQSTAIIGPDDSASTYCMLYYDSRGVSRIYEMSLTDREWKLWRSFPGFSQRFHGAISTDGRTIRANWEKSTDGRRWEHDFDLLYEKVGS